MSSRENILFSLIVTTGLIKDIRTADKQMKDLKGAVDMVCSLYVMYPYPFLSNSNIMCDLTQADRNREKFQHITSDELAQRRGFVEEMTKELAGAVVLLMIELVDVSRRAPPPPPDMPVSCLCLTLFVCLFE